ncbi:hypothetical protein QAD02_009721 [Eretmocerus hayati]|uniref:Uncharacterized protein n=1 Tax=Eretmocerus hayati TaxID=131215 RepID=A0ACC2NBE1_9HYME|nr:hypothetical protein QAD02_009721 [Eretmocerus hayati]
MLMTDAAAVQLSTKIASLYPDGPCRLFHKPGIFLSPKQLDDWEIPMTCVKQIERDTMFLAIVFHAAGNGGLNLAITQNYSPNICVQEKGRGPCKCLPKVAGSHPRDFFQIQKHFAQANCQTADSDQ